MQSQETLAQKFQAGDKSGQASNVSIVRLVGGWTALVGYGWAVYAVRVNNGNIHVYPGWKDYSVSTSCQFTRMGLIDMADRLHDSDSERDRQPTVSEFQQSPLEQV